MALNIIGLDLSLTCSGIARADGELVTVRTKATSYDLIERRDRLETLYQGILGHCAGPCDMVVIEGPAISTRAGGHDLDRYGLWWRVVGSLLAQNIRVIDLPPTSLKKYATGKGTAKKIDMALALQSRTGISTSDDNKVDAAWLRYAGHEIAKEPLLEMPMVNRSALSKWMTS